jgi:hypothetical protein
MLPRCRGWVIKRKDGQQGANGKGRPLFSGLRPLVAATRKMRGNKQRSFVIFLIRMTSVGSAGPAG